MNGIYISPALAILKVKKYVGYNEPLFDRSLSHSPLHFVITKGDKHGVLYNYWVGTRCFFAQGVFTLEAEVNVNPELFSDLQTYTGKTSGFELLEEYWGIKAPRTTFTG